MWSIAVLAHLLQGSACCAFWDAFNHHICKEKLFELAYPSCQLGPVWPLSFDLSH